MPAKKKSKQLKKTLLGLEIEVFTLDQEGNIIPAADRLLNLLKKHKISVSVKGECALNMLEISSFPGEEIQNSMQSLLVDLETLLHIADKEGILILPLGTYPGKFNPKMRKDKPYKIKQSIFGKDKFKIAGRCTGLHCHYTLPRGVFDPAKKVLKALIMSKIKDTVVHTYNMLIAMDPALTAFMQSSPFYEGKNIGKDSRMIVYRGGDFLKYPDGLYSKFQNFGGLQPYKSTSWDLLDIISLRYKRWERHIKSLGMNIKTLSLYGSTLDTTWNPVKVNPNGTLEQRGMDMNHPVYIISVAILMKYIIHKIQKNYYEIVPSEIAIKEPFKREGRKIYIPPHTYVRQKLQYYSAYEGFKNKELMTYCNRLLRLAKPFVPDDRKKLLEPLERMIKEKKTVSDQILEEAKKKGYKKGILHKNIAREIAISHSERLFKEIVTTRNMIADLE